MVGRSVVGPVVDRALVKGGLDCVYFLTSQTRADVRHTARVRRFESQRRCFFEWYYPFFSQQQHLVIITPALLHFHPLLTLESQHVA